MSYAKLHPSYYQALQPDGPWEAGAPGWFKAPFVGWGENPDRSLPPMLAVDGSTGCGCSAGVGDEVAAQTVKIPVWPIVLGYGAVALLAWGAFRYAKRMDRAR